MKHGKKRFLYALLAACMIFTATAPVSAAEMNPGTLSYFGYGRNTWSSWWNRFWGNWGNGSNKPGNGNSGNNQNEKGPDGVSMTLVEDQSMVADGATLRGTTYETTELADTGDTSTIVYYPATLIDYDKNKIAQSMADLDVQYAVDHDLSTSSTGWTWNGLYFNYSGSLTGSYDDGSETASYQKATVSRWSAFGTTAIEDKFTGYYYTEDGQIYSPVNVTIKVQQDWWGNNSYSYTLKANNKTIDSYDNGQYPSRYKPSVTLYTKSSSSDKTITSSSYAKWQQWGDDGSGNNPSYIHSGIVTELKDGIPQFAASYANRLFDSTTLDGKTVYTNVGIPYQFDPETGYYTFDSAKRGTYFKDGAASDTNLTLLDAPVLMYNSTPDREDAERRKLGLFTGFMPFDTPSSTKTTETYRDYDYEETQKTGEGYKLTITDGICETKNYYFTMNASVPFGLTSNGCVNSSDNNSDPIKFDFTGDDDVWVFIDDVLVLDLGGIHDCVYGSIDFAANKVTFGAVGSGKKAGDATDGGYGVASTTTAGLSQGKIFNEGGEPGKLNMTRETFAATDNHTLTVIYMERGDGLSNCKISFNLPQKDYVAVTKAVDPKLYDQKDPTKEKGTLSDELWSSINARPFTFVLYEDSTAMSNTSYSLYDANGNFLANYTTGSDGSFSIKPGQTARFYDVNFDGKTQYHLEELKPGTSWGEASFKSTLAVASKEVITAAVEARDGFYSSEGITAKGSTEAVDVVTFTCTNKLLDPAADIAEDKVVIDYGIPDEIDVLRNDTYTGVGTLVLKGLSLTEDKDSVAQEVNGKYGTLTIAEGKVVYRLTSQMTGVDTFYYSTKIDGYSEVQPGVGTLTIIPATSMYYEEDFNNLVTFVKQDNAAEWLSVGESQGGYQEEGVVGNHEDHPYGSDNVYLNNSGDSYGTSMYVSTKDKAAQFKYTFTGKGTSFFARTSINSGYMRVVVTNHETGEALYTLYRDTSYKDDAKTGANCLYNIPVFTWMAEEYGYGTYDVTVTIARNYQTYVTGADGNAVKSNVCNEFYLDGIRVYEPIDDTKEDNPDYLIADDAYKADGERYCKVLTLREKLLREYTDYNGENIIWTGDGFVLFTDTNHELVAASDYESNGPKEEVYLTTGQAVTFSLTNWDANANKLYLGIKAPMGSGEVSVNGHVITIRNTTDCYYDIGSFGDITEVEKDGEKVKVVTFKIECTSSNIISITNMKVTGTPDFAIVPSEDIVVGDSDVSVEALVPTIADISDSDVDSNPDESEVSSGDSDLSDGDSDVISVGNEG